MLVHEVLRVSLFEASSASSKALLIWQSSHKCRLRYGSQNQVGSYVNLMMFFFNRSSDNHGSFLGVIWNETIKMRNFTVFSLLRHFSYYDSRVNRKHGKFHRFWPVPSHLFHFYISWFLIQYFDCRRLFSGLYFIFAFTKKIADYLPTFFTLLSTSCPYLYIAWLEPKM